MSEINGPKFSINPMNLQGVQRASKEIPTEITNDIQEENAVEQKNDFSDAKAEALGRSMLFKGTDDVNHDLKVLLDTPEIAENSDDIFEAAYKFALDNGIENPYEEAASASTVSF